MRWVGSCGLLVDDVDVTTSFGLDDDAARMRRPVFLGSGAGWEWGSGGVVASIGDGMGME
jgi:hypothetical protein